MLGFQGGVSIPLVKGGVKAPPAKRQCRAGPKAGARRSFTLLRGQLDEVESVAACTPQDFGLTEAEMSAYGARPHARR
jgi:hypothetical protein